jgi:hypothetical protein
MSDFLKASKYTSRFCVPELDQLQGALVARKASRGADVTVVHELVGAALFPTPVTAWVSLVRLAQRGSRP